MAKGILAQAQARLPANMGGSQGAVRDVPASFTGGQGQSLGVFQPPKRGGGGGGGGRLRLPKKKIPEKLKKEWEEQKAALAEAVKKGYISKEDAAKLAEEATALYTELGDKWGKPNEYSQALRDAASKYGSNATLGVSTGSILEGIIDYNVAKAISEGRAPAGATLPGDPRNYPDAALNSPEAINAHAKEVALKTGDWASAQKYGATSSEIIARGGIELGSRINPNTNSVETIWGSVREDGKIVVEGSMTGGATFYGNPEDFVLPEGATAPFSYGDETFSIDQLEERTDWDAGQDDFSVEEFLSTDTSGGFDDYYSADPGFDWQDYHDTASYSDTDSWSDDAGFGVGNKGGVIRKAGGGNVTVDPRGFPGKPMGTDRVPVWAEEGEYIVTREGTQKFKPLLDKINAYRPPSGTVDGAMSQLDDLINKYAQGGKI